MKNILKKIVAIIVIEAIVFVPLLMVIWFSNELDAFMNLFIVFAIITVAIWGYIIVVVRDMSKSFNDAVESMKKQNAAIAYRLTKEIDASDMKKSDKDKKSEDEEKIDVMKVNLNPADPLIPSKNKGKKNNKNKKIDDNYDDFR